MKRWPSNGFRQFTTKGRNKLQIALYTPAKMRRVKVLLRVLSLPPISPGTGIPNQSLGEMSPADFKALLLALRAEPSHHPPVMKVSKRVTESRGAY